MKKTQCSKNAFVRQQFSDEIILDTLERHGGNQASAARELGVGERTFRYWIKNLCTTKDKAKRIPLRDVIPETGLKVRPRRRKTYVITACQNNTPVHKGFMRALFSLCEHRNAQLIIPLIRYKNVNAYTPYDEYEAVWPSELRDYYLTRDLVLNDNLIVLGTFNIDATTLVPLQGVGAVAKNRSAIIGHSQLAMEMIPTPNYELPRQLMTTGTCSERNYSSSKKGQMASFYHTLGAIIVEIDGDRFYTRQINATEDGSFYDLDSFYSSEGGVSCGHRVDGLVCGDLHVDFIDASALHATFTDSGSIVNICRPRHIYLHDSLDFYSRNHHHRNNVFTNYAKHRAGFDDVQAEVDRLVEFHNRYLSLDDTTYHYIASNHPDAFLRWLNETDPKSDPKNALFYHRMMVMMLEQTQMSPGGADYPDPMALYMGSRIINPDTTYFHRRNDKVVLNGIDLSQHGDKGPNGSRGSLSAFAKSGYKSIIGHSHAPGILRGCYRVGTMSLLQLEYNAGYSSWFHTQALVYPNGKRTLINIVKGKWRLV